MKRRAFLAAVPGLTLGQKLPVREEAVEKMVPGDADPKIACSHLGFLPESAKTVVYRGKADSFTLRDIVGYPKPFSKTFPLKAGADALGQCVAGDFSELKREGMYQITIAGEKSVPFFVRSDVWLRTLPKAVSYHHAQRCGTPCRECIRRVIWTTPGGGITGSTSM